MCHFNIQTRLVWPLGQMLEARIDHEFIARGDGLRFTARALTSSYAHDVFEDIPTGGFMMHSGVNYGVPPRNLGKAEASGPVEYELLIERYRRDADVWEIMSRENRVLTTVSESRTPDLTEHELANPALASLSPALRIDRTYGTYPEVRLIMHPSRIFETALGRSCFAVSVTLSRDGMRFGSGTVTWSSLKNRQSTWAARNATMMRWLPMEEWSIHIEPVEGQSWQSAEPLEDHHWSVTIEGDPYLALRDLDATTYWAGKHEFRNIPVERIEK